MAALITVQELKGYPLPVKNNQWDNIGEGAIYNVIDAASVAIQDYLDLGVASAYYTERLTGNGRPSLLLNEYPIIDVQTVTGYDLSETSTSYSLTDFILDTRAGIITWKDRNRNWFWKNMDFVVAYRAGYDVIPGPIKHATALQAIQMLNPLFRGGQSFGETKLVLDSNEEIVDLLEKYKRKRIG